MNRIKGTEQRLVIALTGMTVVTGFIDAVSYVGLGHVFTANMTGNVALLGFAVAGARQLSIARSFLSLAAFLFGALIGGRIAMWMDTAHRRRWLTVGATEAGLLFLAAFAAIGYDANTEAPVSRLYAIIFLTAFAMGLRTFSVRRLAVADITTTVVTTLLAGLAGESSLAGGNNPRIWRRIASVLAIFAGAYVGTRLLRFGLSVPLLLAGIASFGVTIGYGATMTVQESDAAAK
jgi:uncharacterized membrane protein YoaK (UPF0700 family)